MKTIVYRYYCKYRPPMPGTIPRQGLVRIGEYDTPQNVSTAIGSAWGFAEYDRPLTNEEVYQYELAASPNNPLEYDHRI